MADVHRPNAQRGTVHNPVVTMTHAEAVELRRQQDEAFRSSGQGVAAGILAALACFAFLAFAVLGAWMALTH